MTTIRLILALFLVGSGSLFASDWEEVSFPLQDDITGISMVSADTVYLVTSGSKHARTFDGGAHWWGLEFSGNVIFEDANFLSGMNGLVVGRKGVVYVTHDGGKTWVDKSWPDTTAQFISCYMFDLNKWLVVGLKLQQSSYLPGIAIRTEDAGFDWKLLEIPGQAIGDIFVGSDNKISMLSLGFLNQSTDRGVTWKSSSIGDGLPGRRVAFLGNVGVIVGNLGVLEISSDSGKTWEHHTLLKENVHLTSVVIVDKNTIYIGGTGGTLMKSTDAGATWSAAELSIPFDIFDMELRDNVLWAVGSGGHIIRKKNP